MSERTILSTSFREEEVRIVVSVFERILAGQDVRGFASRPSFGSVLGKFQKLREKAEQGKAGHV